MNIADVLELLNEHRNERGIYHWNRLNPEPDSLKSFGIGLTVLRKLAKKIGRNHLLAKQLWKSDIYDVKLISLLINDPKLMTIEDAEIQVDQIHQAQLTHVFSTCDAALAKTSFVVPLLMNWINSDDSMRKQSAYGLLYEVSKSTKKDTPNDVFFLNRIEHILNSFQYESNSIKIAMGNALIGMGKRNIELNSAALYVAQKMGSIDIDSGISHCKPFNIVKHLTSDYLKKKLKI